MNFNSIKVRLKPKASKTRIIVFIVFQFHKGTIKTGTQLIYSAFYRHFNSIKVRLKQGRQSRGAVAIWDFNSIKVRLKRASLPCRPREGRISIP